MKYSFKYGYDLVTVDPADQSLFLDIDEDYIDSDEIYESAVAECDHEDIEVEYSDDAIRTLNFPDQLNPGIYPSFKQAWNNNFAALTLFAAKAKQFDDGFIASLEIALEHGTANIDGRQSIIENIISQLKDHDQDLRCYLQSIQELSGRDVSNPESEPKERLLRKKYYKRWTDDQSVMTPLGVYQWTKELTHIFCSGKALQKKLEERYINSLKQALIDDDSNQKNYLLHQQIQSILTNPARFAHILESGDEIALFPASDSAEGKLVRELIGFTPVPDGFDLANELINAICKKTVDTTPKDESGWYDHLLHAHAALLEPADNDKITFKQQYKDDLKDVFKALFGLTRESHIKQLDTPAVGMGIPLIVKPNNSIEPVCEYYHRRALSYRFILSELSKIMGGECLASIYRYTKNGPVEISIRDELQYMYTLYLGAWHMSCEELGLHNDHMDELSSQAASTTKVWIHNAKNDPDLDTDIRMMVPLFFDQENLRWQVQVCLGWERRGLQFSFNQKPNVRIAGSDENPRVYWSDSTHTVPRAVCKTIWTKQLKTRDEVCEILDAHDNINDALAALAL